MPTMEMGDMGSPKLKILAIVVIARSGPTWATGTGLIMRRKPSPPR